MKMKKNYNKLMMLMRWRYDDDDVVIFDSFRYLCNKYYVNENYAYDGESTKYMWSWSANINWMYTLAFYGRVVLSSFFLLNTSLCWIIFLYFSMNFLPDAVLNDTISHRLTHTNTHIFIYILKTNKFVGGENSSITVMHVLHALNVMM